MDTRIKLRVQGLTNSQIQSGAYALILAEEDGVRRIPIIVGKSEAQSIAIALDYFGGDSIVYGIGDRVRVTGGVFKGAEGYIKRIKGRRRLIVSITGICAVATSFIPNCFLRME